MLPYGEYGLVREKDIIPIIILIENSNCAEEECIAMSENI